MSSVTKSYANAIFEILDDNIKKERVNKEFKYFSDLLKENKELSELLLNPTIQDGPKKEVLMEIFNKLRFTSQSKKSILHILEAKRLDLFKEISDILSKLVDDSLSRQDVYVITARKLSKLALSPVIKEIENHLKDKKINYIYQIDEKIIGGVIVKINNSIYDYSIKKSLETIKNAV